MAEPPTPDPSSSNPFVAEYRDYDLNPFLHPLEASHGYGGHLVDMAGRDFVDVTCAWGTNLLGYGYPRVADAIARQAELGIGFGMPEPQFHRLVSVIKERIPGADWVRFGKNGSDVTLGAVRLARAVTGRERVLYRGFHGFNDWYMASTPCRGIPESIRGLVSPLTELTVEALDRELQADPPPAALIMNPFMFPIPDAETVAALMERVREAGALVIFDELMSGFRIAFGGMAEVWGVKPDIGCFGKSIANGMPLAVLVGRQEHAAMLPQVNFGMTFEGEAVSLAAANATLDELIEADVIAGLHEKGRWLKERCREIAERLHLPARLDGPDPCPHLTIDAGDGLTAREQLWLAVQELVRARVFTMGGFILCHSHTTADLEQIASGLERALEKVGEARRRGSVGELLDERTRRGMEEVEAPATWRRLTEEPEAAEAGPARDELTPTEQRAILARTQAERLLLSALARLQSGDTETARRLLTDGLAIDPGLNAQECRAAGPNPVAVFLDRIVAEASSPGSLSALANLQLALGDRASARRLFQGYLERAPEAPDRVQVEQTIAALTEEPGWRDRLRRVLSGTG